MKKKCFHKNNDDFQVVNYFLKTEYPKNKFEFHQQMNLYGNFASRCAVGVTVGLGTDTQISPLNLQVVQPRIYLTRIRTTFLPETQHNGTAKIKSAEFLKMLGF